MDETLHMAVTDPAYETNVKRMIEIAFTDVPRIPLYQPYLDAATQKDVTGFASWFRSAIGGYGGG